jgi:hypothetical protein
VIIQELYNRATSDMMERGGFQLGLVTDAQFLDFYVEAALDFLEQSEIIKTVICIEKIATVADYPLPDYVEEINHVASAGQSLFQSNETDQSAFDAKWLSRVGMPKSWRQDKGSMKTVSIVPAPSVAGNQVQVVGAQRYGVISSVTAGEFDIQATNIGLGTIGDENGSAALIVSGSGLGIISSMVSGISNLLLVCTAELYGYTPTLQSPVELLPDTLAIYIGYRILAKIFSMDGECKDELRRRYCQARFEEGITLAQAIVSEQVGDQDNG